MTVATDPTTAARDAAHALAERTGADRHDVAVVLGSGWVPAADALAGVSGPDGAGLARPDGAGDRAGGPGSTVEFPVTELPGFLPPTVAGHAGRIRSLDVGGRRVLAFLGRTHLYEGRGVEPVVHAVRVAAAAGCRVVVLTNACGCLRPGVRVGDPVLISDHLNLTGSTPLVGPRFVDLSDLYARRLRELVRTVAPDLAEGVYAQFHGPQYETPAEVRMAGTLGADLVGMSTALEAIAARAEGCEVLGVSLVTNLAAGLGDPLDHEEVLAVGKASATRMGELLARVIPQL